MVVQHMVSDEPHFNGPKLGAVDAFGKIGVSDRVDIQSIK
jgi:hypothetical protein